MYGSKDSKKFGNEAGTNLGEVVRLLKGQALHAYLLGFIHPVSGEKISFKSILPSEIMALLK